MPAHACSLPSPLHATPPQTPTAVAYQLQLSRVWHTIWQICVELRIHPRSHLVTFPATAGPPAAVPSPHGHHSRPLPRPKCGLLQPRTRQQLPPWHTLHCYRWYPRRSVPRRHCCCWWLQQRPHARCFCTPGEPRRGCAAFPGAATRTQHWDAAPRAPQPQHQRPQRTSHPPLPGPAQIHTYQAP